MNRGKLCMLQFMLFCLSCNTPHANLKTSEGIKLEPSILYCKNSSELGTVNVVTSAMWKTKVLDKGVRVYPEEWSEGYIVKVLVDSNNSTEKDQVKRVCFYSDDGKYRDTLYVNQRIKPVLIVSDSLIHREYKGGLFDFEVISNGLWKIESLSEGLVLIDSIGEGSCRVTCFISESVVDKEYFLQVSGVDNDLSRRVKICQEGFYLNYGGDRYPVFKDKSGRIWMAENLRYLPIDQQASDKASVNMSNIWYARGYAQADSLKKYGFLYNWKAVSNGEESKSKMKGICPDGWYLPTVEDYEILLEGYKNDNGVVLIDSLQKAGLNLTFPSFCTGGTNGKYLSTKVCMLWTSTPHNLLLGKGLLANGQQKPPRAMISNLQYQNAYSVRCIKNR